MDAYALGNQLRQSLVALDAKRITIDLDPAHGQGRDPTHGIQRLLLITAHFELHSHLQLDQFEQARAE